MAELSEIYHELDVDQKWKVDVLVGWYVTSMSAWDMALHMIDPSARGIEALEEHYSSVVEQIKEANKDKAETDPDAVIKEQEALARWGQEQFGARKFAIHEPT